MTYPKDFIDRVAYDKQLTEKQKEVFFAIFGEGLNRTQTSQILNISDGALRERLSQIYRAFGLIDKTDKKESLLKNLLALEYRKYQSKLEVFDEEISVEKIVNKARSNCCPKIELEYGKIRLLNGKRVDVKDLYVDVYLLEEISNRSYENKDQLFLCFELDGDRLALGKRKERYRGLDIVQSSNYSKLVTLGKPGSGKSTFLQHVAICCSYEKNNSNNFLSNYVPIFIELRSVDLSVFDIFSQVHLACSLDDKTKTQEILEHGKALLLLDGLDEVPRQFRKTVQQEIKQFSQKYYKNRFILTCRTQTAAYDLNSFEYLEVADFNDEQVDNFIQKWFYTLTENNGEKLKKELLESLKRNPSLAELAVTPILLSLICIVFQNDWSLPLQRSDLYNRGFYLLLDQWDRDRGILRDSNSNIYKQLSAYEKKRFLSEIAINKFQMPKNFVLFDQEEIENKIASKLSASRKEAHIILQSIESQHGLLIERAQQIWSFSHLTFQEYLVAYHIKNNWSDEILVRVTEYMLDEKWREVFLLLCEMLDSPDILIKAMKGKIDNLIEDCHIHEFINWIFEKSSSICSPYKSSTIRAYYFILCRGIDDDRTELMLEKTGGWDLASLLGLQRDAALGKGMKGIIGRMKDDYSEDYVPDLARDEHLIESLSHFVWMDEKISDSDRSNDALLLLQLQGVKIGKHAHIENPLKAEIEKHLGFLPNSKEENNFKEWWYKNGKNWLNQLRNILIQYQNIGHDWNFDEPQKKQLKIYYSANKLLIECLQVATRTKKLSVDFSQKIECSLLLSKSVRSHE